MSWGRASAVVLALGGTALTIDLNGGASAKGIVFGVTSALVYAVYVFTSARVVGPAGPLAASTVILGSAGVVYGGLMLAQGPAWPQTEQGWMAIGALSLLSTVVAVLTFFAGMERVGPVVASLLSTVKPLVAVLLGAFVLGERLALLQGMGGLLILTAVVLLARPEKPLAATPMRPPYRPGSFVRIPLADGSFGYGRILELPFDAFYDYRTTSPDADLDRIASKPVLFRIVVRHAKPNRWQLVGWREIEGGLAQPIVQFTQDVGDFRHCTIYDSLGNERDAEPQECIGLEPSAVWEQHAVEERLLDAFMGRPNATVEHLKVRLQ